MKHRFNKSAQAPSPMAGLSDPFEAAPAVAEDVEEFEDARGRLQLQRRVPPKGRVGRFLEGCLGWRRCVRINLDEQGSFFWRQIDGARCLRDIERSMRPELGLSQTQSERATIAFTKMLMLRRLIWLKVPTADEPARMGQEE